MLAESQRLHSLYNTPYFAISSNYRRACIFRFLSRLFSQPWSLQSSPWASEHVASSWSRPIWNIFLQSRPQSRHQWLLATADTVVVSSFQSRVERFRVPNYKVSVCSHYFLSMIPYFNFVMDHHSDLRCCRQDSRHWRRLRLLQYCGNNILSRRQNRSRDKRWGQHPHVRSRKISIFRRRVWDWRWKLFMDECNSSPRYNWSWPK